MLFHSQLFILLFLPAVWLLWRLLSFQRSGQAYLLVTASLVFYAWWDWRFLSLILGSIVVNWLLSRVIASTDPKHGYALIAAGVAANLGLLGFFKYLGFARDVLSELGLVNLPMFEVVLPIGISFFTFQQISYLVDLRRSGAPAYPLRDYALYVSFFPQLIAGPIVRHNELIPQFAVRKTNAELLRLMAPGIVLFTLGAAKKVLIADKLAPHADAVFADAATVAPGLAQSWSGLLSFGFQIYFDFSAYSDMAIGLALLFGLRLPVNFDAPYRATSLREFWRRWHMTLSRFLRDYLYFGLGGNRRGVSRQTAALMITMALCGLWHGAGWPFVVWGVWHGVGLVANNLWRRAGLRMPAFLGWPVTMIFVLLGWTLFRAPDAATLVNIASGLCGGGTTTGATGPDNTVLWLAAALVTLAPTSQKVVFEYLRPYRFIAIATAVLLAALVLEMGGGRTEEFIYFQF
jgi:D-alanyl-lipoteichoic acid acyltransferase DltB (MBOAT superfamily)